jgi:hypothetical protein
VPGDPESSQLYLLAAAPHEHVGAAGSCGLAWHVFRCVGMVYKLPALCTWQGQPTAYSSSPAHPHPSVALHPRAPGPGGPLPTLADGYRYLFNIVDRSSRWLEATPLKAMAADDCVMALISTWVDRFGMPAVLTSDQSRQLPIHFGLASPSCWGFSMCRPPPTILNPTGW